MIVDTSFLISFYDELDSNHHKARELMEKYSEEQLIISNFVIGETATVLLYKKGPEAAKAFSSVIRDTDNFTIYFLSQEDFWASFEVFRSQKKQLSFIDASLVYLSKVLNRKILTFDENILRETRI